MNYQITQQMPSVMIWTQCFSTSFGGRAFKRFDWDSNLNGQCAQFCKSRRFYLSHRNCKDLYTSPRYAHVIRYQRMILIDILRGVVFIYQLNIFGSGEDPYLGHGTEIEGVGSYEDSESIHSHSFRDKCL